MVTSAMCVVTYYMVSRVQVSLKRVVVISDRHHRHRIRQSLIKTEQPGVQPFTTLQGAMGRCAWALGPPPAPLLSALLPVLCHNLHAQVPGLLPWVPA